MPVYAVCSENQKKYRNGSISQTRDLARAVTEAVYAAQRLKKRMCVIILRK
jgi:hypothetical protein